MKKLLLILFTTIIILFILVFIENLVKKDKFNEGAQVIEKSFSNNMKIKTVLSLEDEIKDDTIWCGTFQLIWNDLKNELAKQDIIFTPQLKVVENLNKETFRISDLSENSYYKKLGIPNRKLKEEIEKAIKDKFNETSDILDDFYWGDSDTNGDKNYFLYVMLKKVFDFENAFEDLGKGDFKNYKNIQYFGIEKEKSDELLNQVEVLYYNSKEDFSIKLKTKQKDEVILCKSPKGSTFNEVYNNIMNEEKNYIGSSDIQKGEVLKIPNIKLKEKNVFTELANKPFFFSNGVEYEIGKAVQTIQFELDRKGGKIKSEAGMMLKNSAVLLPEEKREFAINNTFAIFLIEKDKKVPYFAAKINDIRQFQ